MEVTKSLQIDITFIVKLSYHLVEEVIHNLNPSVYSTGKMAQLSHQFVLN